MDLSPGYRESPAAGLACVWVGVAGDGGRRTRVLPDACVDVIWRRGEGAFVAGPDTSAEVTDAVAGDVLVGARFCTGTGAGALGVPLHALRDQRVPLVDLRPDLDADLRADLDPDAALALLRALGSPHAGRRRAPAPRSSAPGPAPAPPGPDLPVLAAVRALRDPHRRVGALAGDIGLSERQLRRRCDAAVGYGPKHLQRVLRLQAFLTAAEAQDPEDGLMRVALDAGYSDQSHLTTDCTRLTGLAPAALLRERAG